MLLENTPRAGDADRRLGELELGVRDLLEAFSRALRIYELCGALSLYLLAVCSTIRMFRSSLAGNVFLLRVLCATPANVRASILRHSIPYPAIL